MIGLAPSIMLGLALGLGAVAIWLGATVPVPLETLSDPAEREAAASLAARASRLIYPGWSLVLAPVGALIVARRSANRVGWIVLALGLTVSAGAVAGYAADALGGRESTLGFGFGFAADISWLVMIFLLSWFLLLFPDGHLPSRRWLPLAWAAALYPPLFLVVALISPQTPQGDVLVANPFGGLGGPVGVLLTQILRALSFALPALAIGVVLAFIARFRRSRGLERQQLKWFAYAAGVFGLAVVVSELFPSLIGGIAVDVAVYGLPIAVAISILRYRLYDIDLLINRTVVYGLTSAAIAVTFFAGIVALQSAVLPITSGSELAVAASTLLSFALFQPVRRRVQDAVDRRFDRARYDAARTLEVFADRLRDEVDLDALRLELIQAARHTVAPAHASLWLRRPEP